MFHGDVLLLLGIIIFTVIIILFKAVFCLQAKLKLAHNIEVLVSFVEEESVEIEITVIASKSNLDHISSANGVLKVCYCEDENIRTFPRLFFIEVGPLRDISWT